MPIMTEPKQTPNHAICDIIPKIITATPMINLKMIMNIVLRKKSVNNSTHSDKL